MTGRAARWTVAGCVAATFAMAVATFLLARGLAGAPGVGNVAGRARDVMIPAVYVLTGAALVCLQLSRAEDLDGLLQRMGESKVSVQYLKPGTPEYEFLVA